MDKAIYERGQGLDFRYDGLIAGLVSGVCKGGLVFRLCPSSRHIRAYSHTTLHQELVSGVASYPIHVPPGSATAQVNIMCIFNNTDC